MEDSDWIAQIVDQLLDHDLKLVYADWLEERRDPRAEFMRQYVHALKTMKPEDFPSSENVDETWMDLIGFRIVELAAELGCPSLRDTLLRLARPALRMELSDADDHTLPVGSTKIGGMPDLPTDYPWPRGEECQAIYNDDTSGVKKLAGFLAQINLEDLATTYAGRLLPKSGLLSFFCFQEIEQDWPDQVGVKVAFISDVSDLIRTSPPKQLSEGNQSMPTQALRFVQTLDIPDDSGPWEDDLQPAADEDYEGLRYHFRELNFSNLLGYARGTSGDDPTESKEHRHLIVLENSVGCTLHLQIHAKQLAARNFDAVEVAWVDFD